VSFILDALRKSEHARQKQTGPGLAEVPVVASRPKTNVWATAAIVLLVVNLAAVGVLLLRRANDQPASTATATAAPATATTATTTPSEVVPPATSTGPTLSPTATSVATAPTSASRPPAGGRNPLAAEVGDSVPPVDPSLVAGAAAVPERPPAVTRQAAAPTRRGTVVYAPVPEAADPPYTPPASVAPEPQSDNLPTADEVAARGGLPPLHLDLHVYSAAPQQRFVFVNSRKYREGEALQEGPVVEQITTSGVVLSYRGARFRLTHN
jgi:general secretion pathway protein B